MKTIMESWKKFIDESSITSTAGQLSEKDKKQAEEVIKQLIALQLGTEAAAGVNPEGDIEEGKASMRRRNKKERVQRTKKIKRLAGLNGIKLADFTPEQDELFKQAKMSFREKEAEAQAVMAANVAHTLAAGDLLKHPVAKKILDKLPAAAKTALLAAAGDNCIQSGAITLTCLIQGYGASFGMTE